MLNLPCVPEISLTRLWCTIILMCCRIWFRSILLAVFVLIFVKNIVLYFSFLVVSYQGNVYLRMSLEVFSALQLFGKSFRRIVVKFFKCLIILQWNHLFLTFFCWETFDNWLYLLVTGLFRFSVSSLFNFGRLFLGMYPLLLVYPICWCILVHSIVLYNLFYACGISCNVPCSISDFSYLSLLFFS